jgi:hypothetical protein
MEPRSGTLRKIKPRCIVNYNTSRRPAIDAYEGTAVEVAGMLGAPNSEYEKDIFKCLLAQDRGAKVRKLVFIARPGAAKVSSSPGRGAIAQFVREHYGIEVCVEELIDPETLRH